MNLTYLNYKLPLTQVENGYGYMGTLGQTEDGELLQCHVCGELVANLGHHAWFKHGIRSREYKETYKLGMRTPLCSDAHCAKLKQIGLKNWNALTPEEQKKRIDTMHKHTVRDGGNPRSLEALNKDGMCPDQLIERIQECAEHLGKSPSEKEFTEYYKGKYRGAILRTFGSWNGAKRIAGFPPLKSGSRVPHNRSPYSDEQLLEFLRNFYEEKKEIPTCVDFDRGLLPSRYLYVHRFGGVVNARKLAGIPEKYERKEF